MISVNDLHLPKITINDLKLTKYNLTLHLTLLVISNIVLFIWNGQKLFNNEWKIFTVATIIAYIIHGLLINKIAIKINEKLKIKGYGFKKSIFDIFQYTSVYTLQKIIFTYIIGQEIILDNIWLAISFFTIVGYIIFNFSSFLFITTSPMINDIIKVTIGFVTANFYVENLFPGSEPRSMTILFGVITGLTFFHSFVNKYLN